MVARVQTADCPVSPGHIEAGRRNRRRGRRDGGAVRRGAGRGRRLRADQCVLADRRSRTRGPRGVVEQAAAAQRLRGAGAGPARPARCVRGADRRRTAPGSGPCVVLGPETGLGIAAARRWTGATARCPARAAMSASGPREDEEERVFWPMSSPQGAGSQRRSMISGPGPRRAFTAPGPGAGGRVRDGPDGGGHRGAASADPVTDEAETVRLLHANDGAVCGRHGHRLRRDREASRWPEGSCPGSAGMIDPEAFRRASRGRRRSGAAAIDRDPAGDRRPGGAARDGRYRRRQPARAYALTYVDAVSSAEPVGGDAAQAAPHAPPSGGGDEAGVSVRMA